MSGPAVSIVAKIFWRGWEPFGIPVTYFFHSMSQLVLEASIQPADSAMDDYRDYILETNRAIGDNIKRAARALERHGLSVDVLPHKTTLLIKRPLSMTWSVFKNILASIVQPRSGSLLLFSKHSGRCWICSNRGNQPGVFVEY